MVKSIKKGSVLVKLAVNMRALSDSPSSAIANAKFTDFNTLTYNVKANYVNPPEKPVDVGFILAITIPSVILGNSLSIQLASLWLAASNAKWRK